MRGEEDASKVAAAAVDAMRSFSTRLWSCFKCDSQLAIVAFARVHLSWYDGNFRIVVRITARELVARGLVKYSFSISILDSPSAWATRSDSFRNLRCLPIDSSRASYFASNSESCKHNSSTFDRNAWYTAGPASINNYFAACLAVRRCLNS